MQDTAFNPEAPQDERVDALKSMQQEYMPALSDLLPPEPIREVIDQIIGSYEEDSLIKSAQVIQFPRTKQQKTGMQSVRIDDWSISIQGDYWEKPSALGPDSQRAMVDQTPILNAVVLTRLRQSLRFCRECEKDDNLPGFEIRHVDRKHSLTKSEQENIRSLSRFISNCGWEFKARNRKALRRDSFPQFMGKLVRDSLVLDSVAIETEWKRDRSLGFDGLYAVDGATIRLCTEEGYRGNDEIFALQVVNGVARTAYTFQDLIYEPRNPRSDVRVGAYGLSETELLVRVVTGFLNAMTVNIKGFDSNSIPRGILHLTGNYRDGDLNAFKRYWNSMVRGVNNAWALPVMVSKDQESKVGFEKIDAGFNEMFFAKWMTFLTSIICAIYGMSPAEINFDSFSGGNTSPLAGSDTAEKLATSKDSGLRPLLSYFENLFTDYVINEFSDDYVFRFTGLDPVPEERRFELKKAITRVNEVRAEEGYEKEKDDVIGNAPLNPSLMGLYMQSLQMEQRPEEKNQEENGKEDQEEEMKKSFVSVSDWWTE